MHLGLRPSYGEASAYAVCLMLIVAVPLLLSNGGRPGERARRRRPP